MKKTVTKRIESIWLELEKDRVGSSGLSYKRYSPAVMPDFFIGLRAPQNSRCIAILVKKNNIPDIFQWSYLKDFKVQIYEENQNSKNAFIVAVLQNQQYSELFAVLCEDLVYRVFNTVDEVKLIDTILNRFSKWKTIFEKVASKGLSEDSQRELYGKLFFLRKLLERNTSLIRCIETWVGPTNAVHDFQYGKWAVEIKSDKGYDNQKIQISNERKLDNTIVPNIFLVHLQMDVRVDFGESLMDITQSIWDIISGDLLAKNLFELMLHEAGFFGVHSALYQTVGYAVRDQNNYTIEDGFPSITRKQLARGVSDVKYSILASDCNKYCIDEYGLFEKLIF